MPFDGGIGLTRTQRVLLRAADIVRERGLCKGIIRDQWGRVCAAGAITMAQQENGLGGWVMKLSAVGAVSAELRRRGLNGGIAQWNDEPERTAEDVIAVLEQAAMHG